jgi:thiosulfate reductase cytochrome b subunit
MTTATRQDLQPVRAFLALDADAADRLLLITGFGLHGFHNLFDFEDAVTLHTGAALALLLLWAFGIFWLFTTRTWRHFIPTITGMWGVLRFYGYGIFKGERHPYRKAYWRKHNPLQALAYLMLKIVLFPAIWISGLDLPVLLRWRDVPHATEWLHRRRAGAHGRGLRDPHLRV